MAKFDVPFANTPGNRRVPTAGEYTAGFPCGALDQQLFNFLMYAPQAEIGAVITEAGITQSNADFTQLLQALKKLFPLKQTSNPILYVRTDGNDGNTGLTNTAGGAMATIEAAINKALTTYYLTGRVVTIKLGNAGTYAFLQNNIVGSTSIIIEGSTSSPSTYIISGAGPSVGNAALVTASLGAQVTLKGLSVNNTSTINHNVAATAGGSLTLDTVIFNNSVATTFSHVYAAPNGTVVEQGGCSHPGFAGSAWSTIGGVIFLAGAITFTSSNFSQSVAGAVDTGLIIVAGGTMSGTATGKRYNVATNGVINTGGGGANFFPGTVAGTTATGGQYV